MKKSSGRDRAFSRMDFSRAAGAAVPVFARYLAALARLVEGRRRDLDLADSFYTAGRAGAAGRALRSSRTSRRVYKEAGYCPGSVPEGILCRVVRGEGT